MKKQQGFFDQKGFSLAEILIVISIMGVLSVIAIVGYRTYIKRANSTVLVNDLMELHRAWQIYSVRSRSYARAEPGTQLGCTSLTLVGKQGLMRNPRYGADETAYSASCNHSGRTESQCRGACTERYPNPYPTDPALAGKLKYPYGHEWYPALSEDKKTKKPNFIGFSGSACSSSLTPVQTKSASKDVESSVIGFGSVNASSSAELQKCRVEHKSYRMAVYAPVGGNDLFVQGISDAGAVKDYGYVDKTALPSDICDF